MTDTGSPPLNDAKSFTVTVVPKPLVMDIARAGGDVVLTWSARTGMTYRVQFKTRVNDADWTNIVPDVTATSSTASKTDPLGLARKFYRVLVVSP